MKKKITCLTQFLGYVRLAGAITDISGPTHTLRKEAHFIGHVEQATRNYMTLD